MPVEGQIGRDKQTGAAVVWRGGKAVPLEAGKLTEDQGKAQGYARMMVDAEERYKRAVAAGYDPGSIRNAAGAIAEGLPFGGLDGLGAFLRDDLGDIGRQSELQWSDAQLKAVSGAASPESEVKKNVRTFFPRPGENMATIGPEKEQARRAGFTAAMRRSGPAAAGIIAPPPRAIPMQPASIPTFTPEQARAAKPGTRFRTTDGRVLVR